jgi:hypothetical protein
LYSVKRLRNKKHKYESSVPRSTSSNGLPLPKIIFGPAYLKASAAVHSAVPPKNRQGINRKNLTAIINSGSLRKLPQQTIHCGV